MGEGERDTREGGCMDGECGEGEGCEGGAGCAQVMARVRAVVWVVTSAVLEWEGRAASAVCGWLCGRVCTRG